MWKKMYKIFEGVYTDASQFATLEAYDNEIYESEIDAFAEINGLNHPYIVILPVWIYEKT